MSPFVSNAIDHSYKLRGTKYACGIGLCGACTVHVDGHAAQFCLTPISSVNGKAITTIEGLSSNNNGPVQLAWRKLDVPQCGYCQPGMMMAAAALLRSNPSPSDAEIDAAITNVCRCGTYSRVRQAIHMAAKMLGEKSDVLKSDADMPRVLDPQCLYWGRPAAGISRTIRAGACGGYTYRPSSTASC